MSTTELVHPSQESLSAFNTGRLGAVESAEIERHLAECEACCRLLKSLPGDTLISLLRDGQTDTKAEPGRTILPGEVPTEGNALGGAAEPGVPPDLRPSVISPTLAPSAAKTHSAEQAILPAPAGVPLELQNHSRYRIVSLLGRGGMGSVYEAEHRLMNRPVALKVIDKQLVQTPGLVERFQREVQAAAKLSHPNIVAAHDAEQAADLHFLVMELVRGQDLSQVIGERGRLPVPEACEYLRQAALGLQHAHERGMVHRDIKPQDLMLTPEGQVKILDFGLAQFASEIAEVSGLTQVGTMMGTPDYMAPEQARDAHSADIRADIYSLGCTLYCLLAGQAPFPRGSILEKILAHVERDPTSLTELRDDVPSELLGILQKMMAKKPADRYQTPAEVAEALAPFAQSSRHTPCAVSGLPQEGHATHARRDSSNAADGTRSVPATFLPTRRRSRVLGVTALATIAILALFGVIVVATAKGRVEIQSEVDDVEVSVKQGGKEIDFFDVKTGSRVKWYSSGKYDIQLKEDRNDIEIVNGGFKLTRWGKVVVTLRRKTDPVAKATTPDVQDQPKNSPPPAFAPFNTEQARKHQEAWAKYLGVDVEVTNSIGMKLRLIPPGEFTMGYTKEQAALAVVEMADWEKQAVAATPGMQVEIDQPYYLAIHEVTFEQFRRFVKATAYRTVAERNGLGGAVFDFEQRKPVNDPKYIWSHRFAWSEPNGPVEFVTPEDGAAFCDWLSEMEGRQYVLPDDRQWEYACRAGTTTLWWTGDRQDDLEQSERIVKDVPRNVGTLKPNPFGLYDMHGNHHEWVRFGDTFAFRGGAGGHDIHLSHSARQSGLPKENEVARIRTGFRAAVVNIGESKAKTPPVAATPADVESFVVLDGKNKKEHKFPNLAEAIAATLNGDTIEIRGNGPFVTPPIQINGKALTIRAGLDCQPVLKLDPEGVKANADLLTTDAPLVLEGLELTRLGSSEPVEGRYPNLVDAASNLRIANCRFIQPDRADFVALVCDGETCEVLNSIILGTPSGLARITGPARTTTVENSLFACSHNAVGVQEHKNRLPAGAHQASRNTIISGVPFNLLQFGEIPDDDVQPDAVQSIRWRTSGNVVHSSKYTFAFDSLHHPPEVKEALLRRLLAWEENSNVYQAETLFLGIMFSGKSNLAGLGDWEKFWDLKDTGSKRGRIRFAGGDIWARMKSSPETLVPADFRLHPDSAGKGAGPGGKDLGADVDLVGPGAPYERWKKKPEYQEWLKRTSE